MKKGTQWAVALGLGSVAVAFVIYSGALFKRVQLKNPQEPQAYSETAAKNAKVENRMLEGNYYDIDISSNGTRHWGIVVNPGGSEHVINANGSTGTVTNPEVIRDFSFTHSFWNGQDLKSSTHKVGMDHRFMFYRDGGVKLLESVHVIGKEGHRDPADILAKHDVTPYDSAIKANKLKDGNNNAWLGRTSAIKANKLKDGNNNAWLGRTIRMTPDGSVTINGQKAPEELAVRYRKIFAEAKDRCNQYIAAKKVVYTAAAAGDPIPEGKLNQIVARATLAGQKPLGHPSMERFPALNEVMRGLNPSLYNGPVLNHGGKRCDSGTRGLRPETHDCK